MLLIETQNSDVEMCPLDCFDADVSDLRGASCHVKRKVYRLRGKRPVEALGAAVR